jgi:glycosyltransferase involved in cell wall biosynthesis
VKVLHFFKRALPESRGGIEQVINQLARGGIKHGIQSEVLSLVENKLSATSEYDGYVNHHVKQNFDIASTGFSYEAFSRFAALANDTDIVHFHFPWPFMDLVHLVTRANKPTVVTYHSDVVRQKLLMRVYRPLMNAFLCSADSVVASSPNYMNTSEVLQKFASKVSVIPYGLDKSTYATPDSQSMVQWTQKLGPKFFLFVGVLRYYKGLHILIDAAQGLDYPIVIAGAGPIESELKAMAQSRGLKNIHFVGHLSEQEKSDLLALCYAVVFPSHLRSEAFGISLLEGAMYGKPMVSSEIGTGTTYINIGNETGLVVPPSNPVALRRAMKQLWEHPEQAVEMGKRAEARYWKLFTAERMVQSYANLYKQVLAKGATKDTK